MLILAISILVLVILVSTKLNPMLALLLVSIMAGLMFGMPITAAMSSINTGVGSTLGSIALILALGAMIGKLAEESGAAQKMVIVLAGSFGKGNIQWAVLITGLLAGIPLFYNAGFVILVPLVFAIAKTTGLNLLYVGIPMAASLSVTHGFLPPHPGPVAIIGIFNADMGEVLMLGLILAIPIAIIAGIIFPRLITRNNVTGHKLAETIDHRQLPPAWKSFAILLSPVLFITIGTAGSFIRDESIFEFLQDPVIALLLSLLLAIVLVKKSLSTSMLHCVEGVKSVAMIILIIAAGGGFKQVLIDSHIGETIKELSSSWDLSPLFLAWCITAIFRIALGSATVAALTASGMVLPLITPGVSAELMVLSVGAGSLMCSHVNDTGFWMFKEYFGLSVKETFKTWTVMESVISVLGLGGVLVLAVVMS